MAEEFVPIMCYHGGRIVMQGRRPEYDGGSMDGILMNKSILYPDLLKKVCVLTSNDPKKFKLIMKCRFPTSGSDYVALEVKDETTTKMMFGLYPRVYSLELFVEKFSINDDDELIESLVREPMEMRSEGGDSLSSSLHGINEEPDPSNSNYLFDNASQPSIVSIRTCGTTAEPNGRDGSHTTDPIDHLLGAVDDDHHEIHISDISRAENMEVDSKGKDPDWKTSEEEDEDDWVSDSIIRNTCRGLEDDPASGDSLLHVGKLFKDKEALKQSLQEYSIRRHVEYKVLRSTKKIFHVRCTHKGCPWQVRSRLAKRLQRFKIKSYGGDHTCGASSSVGDHKQCDTKFISKSVMPLVKRKSTVTPAEIIEWMENKYSIKISYSKAWLGLNKALKKIHGSWDDSYAMLQEYLNLMKEANPGTVVQLLTNEKGEVREFCRLFWSFSASIEGFRHLRPMITIDSAELHGKYSGSLLVATGVDGNDGLFPLAFAVTDSETEETWTWFLGCIKNFVTSKEDITFISDCGRGLMEAITAVYSSQFASHRCCMRQLSCSLRKEFKDETLVNLFWEAAKKTETCEFNETMKILGERNPTAREWLERVGTENWSFAHDGGKRYGIMTTNIVETCDTILKGVRGLPIKVLVGKTLSRLRKIFNKRSEAGSRMLGHFTSTVESQLVDIVNLAGQHMVEPYSAMIFNVYRVNHRPHTVNAEGYACTCNRFLLSRIPCSHIAAVCMSMQISYYNLCAEYFASHTYRQTYAAKLHPVEDESSCPTLKGALIMPPAMARRRGRPPSVRINKGLPSGTYRCSKCKQDGHNFRTCKSSNTIAVQIESTSSRNSNEEYILGSRNSNEEP